MRELTSERLRSLVNYDPASGLFTFAKSRGGCRKGDAAGFKAPDGYWRLHLDGVRYNAHRLAWFWVSGSWPLNDLDHVNGDRLDNRIANLRECTRSENLQNMALRSDNVSGHIGVSWHQRRKKWFSRIWKDGRQHCLGYFDAFDDAAEAYRRAKTELHEFQPILRAVV